MPEKNNRMLLKKDKCILSDFSQATALEWIETNGLGGYSSSTIIGTSTRRYHGLLVAATRPPTERMLLLSKLDEAIIIGSNRMELGTNFYQGNVVQPKGYQYLEQFTRNEFPQWIYKVDQLELSKTIAMVQGENTVLIMYEVLKAPSPFTLEFLPLMAARNYHALQQAGPQMHWDVEFSDGIFHNSPDGLQHVYISIPGSTYQPTPRWFYQFYYAEEANRGLDSVEDLFNHGVLTVSLKEGDTLGIIVSTENPAGRDAKQLFEKEKMRKETISKNASDNEILQQLLLAADQFIVKREERLKTIIAGYHWFTDWGRDTMISLPGLTLATGRDEEAAKILATFAKNVSMGMLPNRFQDNNLPPEFNNVDGTLWFFIAVYKYFNVTQQKSFVLKEILPVLKQIIDWHYKGTRYHIKVDEDGLLYSGEAGQQLTWMDARVGDWVVTPRRGKPVEIQALWYNALKIFATLLATNEEKKAATAINEKAEQVKKLFNQKYWYAAGGYLYDNIDESGNNITELRPNQLFAISLPFAIIENKSKARSILQKVENHLYTPVGLRSLSPDDEKYISHYEGDQWHRDAAYHQGTVWSWLLGPYMEAQIKLSGETGKRKAKKIISRFTFHLNEAGIGSVSEIFDAEVPHQPRGCIAQAWSVAELLRVIKEYALF
jgi:predicted glycogen debranching enzyme